MVKKLGLAAAGERKEQRVRIEGSDKRLNCKQTSASYVKTSYYKANREKKICNTITPELEGFIRPKCAQRKVNFVEMV